MPSMRRLSELRKLLRDQGGQAMVEYSTITFFMLVGGGGTLLTTFLPKFLDAMNAYLDSVYYIINQPFP